MKLSCAAAVCFSFISPVFVSSALVSPVQAQTAASETAANEPATRDDVILYLRTMHSHDMMQKMMEMQSKSMQQLLHAELEQDNAVPPDFDTHFKKAMGELIKGMPVDEMTQAMIPAYQHHFTKGDIEAMNAFYASPVGQKVLEELPVVTQEGMQDMMPILNKYLTAWRERMHNEFKDAAKTPPAKNQSAPASQN
jgi:hypothetical protein